MTNATATKNKDVSVTELSGPLKVFRLEDVSASIFARDREVKGADRTFYSVSFSRSYLDQEGKRKYTKNFDLEDLGKIMSLAKQASEFIDAAARA